MNRVIKPLFALPLIAVISACGGGGGGGADPTDNPVASIPSLNDAASSYDLQSLALDANGITVSSVAKSSTDELSDTALKYVGITTGGDIIGAAANSIPTGVTFYAGGTASADIAINDINYVLVGGNVVAAIDENAGLTVNLGEFTHVSGPTGTQSMSGDDAQTTAALADDIQVGIETALSGKASGCANANLFCGGTLTIRDLDKETFNVADSNTVEYDFSMETDQFVAGAYGNNATDIELGGVVNFNNGDDDAPVSAAVTFVTGIEK